MKLYEPLHFKRICVKTDAIYANFTDLSIYIHVRQHSVVSYSYHMTLLLPTGVVYERKLDDIIGTTKALFRKTILTKYALHCE